MLQYEIYIGILCGFLTHFINYCIGKPASKEFSPYEIFSDYTVWLSYRRLKKVELLPQYWDMYTDNLKKAKSNHEIITLRNDYRKMLYEAAEPYFTWERAAGMCPVCSGFWITLFVGICWIFFNGNGFILSNLLSLGPIVLISHITIRIISKFL